MLLSKWKKPFLIFLCLSLIFCIGMGIGYVSHRFLSPDGQFTDFTKDLFKSELTGSTLNLHYTLAHPDKYGFSSEPVTLGSISWEDIPETCDLYQKYVEILLDFSPDSLCLENQITRDTLLLSFHTRQSLRDLCFVQEVLSPSLGIQAQLPVLLAEYPFYEEKDITDYLKLLTCIRPYFESILLFEQEKSAHGTFMSGTSVDRVIEQCKAFIEDPSSNYLTQIFENKLENFPGLSTEEITACKNEHQKILEKSVIPAYKRLIEGLLELKGTGKNENGLANLENGKEYYQYLLKTQVGTYDSVIEIQKRMYQQLTADCREITQIFRQNPEVLKAGLNSSISSVNDPASLLSELKTLSEKDFPALPEVDYEVKYVHPSMEDFLSPAFYLTPPIDTGIPNTIYINGKSKTGDLELFTTLAHEGFPGHLYQTQFFNKENPNPVRQIFSSSGYIEGWATYVESYAYGYAPVDASFSRLSWLNRSVNLCLYSLVDIGIHYQGWDLTAMTNYLKAFGIQDSAALSEMYQYIVETPANYLKYYYGYLNFVDLLTKEKEEKGESFDIKDFHQRILEIGPVPFPVLDKYMTGSGA